MFAMSMLVNASHVTEQELKSHARPCLYFHTRYPNPRNEKAGISQTQKRQVNAGI
jgi:hypothetical protein